MTVQQLKKFLEDKPDNSEVYFSVWMGGDRTGEHKFRCIMNNPERSLSPSGKYLRISWVDDCLAHRIPERDYK